MKLFPSVDEAPLPDESLLREFRDRGDYTDCFAADIAGETTLPAYVEAFYTTRLFKLERLILKWLIARPSTDDAARQLARGDIHAFAAWEEYRRIDRQLLMMDFRQRTCSWFMLEPVRNGTRLLFGSAVMAERQEGSDGQVSWAFRRLLGLHRLYSRALLHAAARRLDRSDPARRDPVD